MKLNNPRFFIHIPKNGGMSLRWNDDIKDKITYVINKVPFKEGYGENLDRIMKRLGEDPGYQHCRIRDLNAKYWNIFQPFAIIRNPWDRVASRYFFAQKVIYHETNSDHYHELDYCDCKTFEAFLEERHKWGNKEFMWHRAIRGWYNAIDYMKDDKGSYMDIYTPKTAQIVADWYKEDIEYFGYTFQGGATKNYWNK